jgi:hypothetical protein
MADMKKSSSQAALDALWREIRFARESMDKTERNRIAKSLGELKHEVLRPTAPADPWAAAKDELRKLRAEQDQLIYDADQLAAQQIVHDRKMAAAEYRRVHHKPTAAEMYGLDPQADDLPTPHQPKG